MKLATYNVHKCRGLDGRLRPERILRVLRELNADVYALQEIVAGHAQWFSEELGYHVSHGPARELKGEPYGNVILSRWPIGTSHNCDITVTSKEPRSCLQAVIEVPGNKPVSLFNVHMGTGFFERKQQVRMLLDRALANSNGVGPRVLIGDFNEWVPGLTSRLLAAHLESVDVRLHLRFSKTYPGIFPVLHLDHIYHDAQLAVTRLHVHRSTTSFLASDHLPLLVEFRQV